MKKRWLSALLAASMVLTTIPSTAFAAEVEDGEVQLETELETETPADPEQDAAAEETENNAESIPEEMESDAESVPEEKEEISVVSEDETILPLEVVSASDETEKLLEGEEGYQLYYISVDVTDWGENGEPKSIRYSGEYGNRIEGDYFWNRYVQFFLARPSDLTVEEGKDFDFEALVKDANKSIRILSVSDIASWPADLKHEYDATNNFYYLSADGTVTGNITATVDAVTYYLAVSLENPTSGFAHKLVDESFFDGQLEYEGETTFYYYLHEGDRYIAEGATCSAEIRPYDGSQNVSLSTQLDLDGKFSGDTDRYALKITIPKGTNINGELEFSVVITREGGQTYTANNPRYLRLQYSGTELFFAEGWIQYEDNEIKGFHYSGHSDNRIDRDFVDEIYGNFVLAKRQDLEGGIKNAIDGGAAVVVSPDPESINSPEGLTVEYQEGAG